MARRLTAAELLARGVYKAPYLVDGFEVLFAVDNEGTARKHVKIAPDFPESVATRWLEDWLDRHHPLPRMAPALVLIKPDPPHPRAHEPQPSWPYSGDPPVPDRFTIERHVTIDPTYP